MPNYHDEFWKFILTNLECAIEFFRFILKYKVKYIELEKIKSIQNLDIKNKKIPIDLVFEIPLKQSKEKIYFLLEHKSRKEKRYYFQILQYKTKLREWQKFQFGKFYPIVPILFSQGLDGWDPEKEILDSFVENPILSEKPKDLIIFDLRKIDPQEDFQVPEMKAGLLILKEITKPWDEFVTVWREIQKILKTIKKPKRIALEDAMSNYIFKSRKEDKSLLEELIMGRRVLTAYERAVEEGKEEGKLEGLLVGKLEGILEGKQEGELTAKLDTARRMWNKRFSLQEISEITGLSEVQLMENGISV
jgi:predicted transposase/invertase (TIGR01784 family)